MLTTDQLTAYCVYTIIGCSIVALAILIPYTITMLMLGRDNPYLLDNKCETYRRLKR